LAAFRYLHSNGHMGRLRRLISRGERCCLASSNYSRYRLHSYPYNYLLLRFTCSDSYVNSCVHTRIPAFAGRISIPFLAVVCGIVMIMPNYGFNEWGHTFFYAEELFAAPIHYGFVFLGWSLFFLVPLSMQLIGQMSRLISASANELE